MSIQKQSIKPLQVLLWLWFGVISSFVFTNYVNTIRLETRIKNLQYSIDNLKKDYLILQYHILSK